MKRERPRQSDMIDVSNVPRIQRVVVTDAHQAATAAAAAAIGRYLQRDDVGVLMLIRLTG